ncbi:hypothetical protein L1S32_07635 [Methanogenium sp. S4BF]|uniref:hypothetical protein n=1 Tax=Methanogenium sp. S4BF TaxID=1789226 RepID=UPI0024165D79|nr:hypothetical protein [Methanogenium sp. S4BF]WFN33715.1 hypothetical protein L1S32_07635 [Methanogenium sp. S4BF]
MLQYTDRTFLRHLEYRLIEELEEYLESKDPEELADLLEVCYRVAELKGRFSRGAGADPADKGSRAGRVF